jgi:UDPglucose--hexose-1-phosphate uridylyltransferase
MGHIDSDQSLERAQLAAQCIEGLLDYGLREGLLEEWDEHAVRNALLDLLRIAEPWKGPLEQHIQELISANSVHQVEESGAKAPVTGPIALLEPLLEYAAEIGLIPDRTTTFYDLMDARIMGLLMPRQGELIKKFQELAAAEGVEKATDWFYRLSSASNYIRWDRIQNNEYWRTETPYGALEVTINLSKPEKDPKDIAAERAAPRSGYPQCLLCIENVGYAGRINHPARQNHRVLPVKIGGEPWFFQYSPYLYYNEHCILFDKRHTPMKITEQTFIKLLDFVEQFPHYFAGSNADLPIVGGSILSHDHFQGGRHTFPMEAAPVELPFKHSDYPSSSIGIVRWPLSVVRIASENRLELQKLAAELLASWRKYSDSSVDIEAYSEQEETRIPHNTITPIARMNGEGKYELDLVLRNNRCSAEHPDGIFHPHQELHHIKKENIGLIEVMGLAVLPGRLKQELADIRDALCGVKQLTEDELEQPDHPLHKHAAWIERLQSQAGSKLSLEEAEKLLREETGAIFLQVLMDAGVFKQDAPGRQAFRRFLETFGCSVN